jgi:hypothetical protein
MTQPPSSGASAPPVNSRTTVALWLDAMLLLLFLLIQSPRITGVASHEALGLAIAVPLVIHLLLSWHWIVSRAQRLFANGSARTRVNYLINVVLFVAMVIAIVSGAVVSRVVLPAAGIRTISDAAWFETHDFWSNVLFFAIGFHLAMNWGWIDAVVRRHAFSPEEAEANEPDENGSGEPAAVTNE